MQVELSEKTDIQSYFQALITANMCDFFTSVQEASRHAIISRSRLNRRIRSAVQLYRNLQDRSSCSGSFGALGEKSLVNWDQDVTS